MRKKYLAVLFLTILLPTNQASLSGILQETTNPTKPSLLSSKSEKHETTTPSTHEHHVFKHLEEHINSLKHLTKTGADQRIQVMHVPLLFACLEKDSSYENCDKIDNFS